jgi:hypothetical protein
MPGRSDPPKSILYITGLSIPGLGKKFKASTGDSLISVSRIFIDLVGFW